MGRHWHLKGRGNNELHLTCRERRSKYCEGSKHQQKLRWIKCPREGEVERIRFQRSCVMKAVPCGHCERNSPKIIITPSCKWEVWHRKENNSLSFSQLYLWFPVFLPVSVNYYCQFLCKNMRLFNSSLGGMFHGSWEGREHFSKWHHKQLSSPSNEVGVIPESVNTF